MCARFEFSKQICKPGSAVSARAERGIVRPIWAGFARGEILDWWRRKGAEIVDIYADRFAERSDATGKLEWDDVPPDLVIRGVLVYQTAEPILKVVTRASSREEFLRFDHPRMPLLEPPLFERGNILPEAPAQPDLF